MADDRLLDAEDPVCDPPLSATNSRNSSWFHIPQQSAQTPVSLHHCIYPSSLPRYRLTADSAFSNSSLLRIRSCCAWAGSEARTRMRKVIDSIEFVAVRGSDTPVPGYNMPIHRLTVFGRIVSRGWICCLRCRNCIGRLGSAKPARRGAAAPFRGPFSCLRQFSLLPSLPFVFYIAGPPVAGEED